MKIKIQIKSRFTGNVLFELESENNTINNTVVEAVKNKAYLGGAYLGGGKIKIAAVFTGLYKYVVIPYITEDGINRIKMGCYDRAVYELDNDFWNNDNEFPNNGSLQSNMRLMAYNTAKEWLRLVNVSQ